LGVYTRAAIKAAREAAEAGEPPGGMLATMLAKDADGNGCAHMPWVAHNIELMSCLFSQHCYASITNKNKPHLEGCPFVKRRELWSARLAPFPARDLTVGSAVLRCTLLDPWRVRARRLSDQQCEDNIIGLLFGEGSRRRWAVSWKHLRSMPCLKDPRPTARREPTKPRIS
jgi:hypothetical protein